MAKRKPAKIYEHDPFSRRHDFGRDLQGLGGPTITLRGFPGGTYGAASPVRRLSAEERREVEERLRREGALGPA